jgi:hypothetical protein
MFLKVFYASKLTFSSSAAAAGTGNICSENVNLRICSMHDASWISGWVILYYTYENNVGRLDASYMISMFIDRTGSVFAYFSTWDFQL